ncbi:cadherin-86C-like isoform X2 [Eriocheir sinensis]|uniref:cadherin-86C-like isoform X2 n=1 Tax=Eriocheir sinensis TaxID=95602 RepID=UPI0021CAB220|nr:cadherin-86C-like isoform X2 [Eriocheir sinensis]
MHRRSQSHPLTPPTPPPAHKAGGRRGRGGRVAVWAWAWWLGVLSLSKLTLAIVPVFYESARMSALRLPVSTEPGELIYQLRAQYSDVRVPLLFSVHGQDSDVITINSNEDYGLVYLRERLSTRRNYTFILTVQTEGATDGVVDGLTEVPAWIIPTEGRTPTSDIFLKHTSASLVPEDAKVGHFVTSVIVKKKTDGPAVSFMLLGDTTKLFKVSARLNSADSWRAEVLLQGKLDYEKRNLHAIQVCAKNPYTDEKFDSRNIVCVSVSVLVEDRQDLPPLFLYAPPITRITSDNLKDDELVRVRAVDGDQGEPREIRYTLQATSSQYASFFAINPTTGSITLQNTVNRLLEAMVTFEPILVTVTAVEMEEQRTRAPRESYATSVEIAFVIMDSDMMIPKFTYQQYVGEVRENSQPGTAVAFPETGFLKEGLKGVFALRLEGDEGVFAVEPSVVRDSGEISIKVKNTALLDYEERPYVEFELIARQVSGSGQASSSAQIRVNLIDLNDNPPVFSQSVYQTEIYENITAGASIIKVVARDADQGPFGAIKYTRLSGDMADRLDLNAYSGLITRNSDVLSFDRERKPEIHLTVEAADHNGVGNTAMARVVLVLLDVNDEAPVFQHTVYQGVMKPDQTGLRSPIQVQAVDRDAEEPNNQVRYGLEPSAFSTYFSVDTLTGELRVVKALSYPQVSSISDSRPERTYEEEIIQLNVIAFDLGTPQLTTTVPVQIFREEFVERFITFIYPRPKIEVELKRADIEGMLRTLTGGNAQIRTVEHFTNQDTSRSIVTALVRNNVNTVVDIEKILKQLNNTQPVACKLEGVQLSSVQGERDSYLAGVVILCVLLALVILLIILCYMWSICPLYRVRKSRKVVAEEGGPDSERVSYIRVDERGGYRGYEEERTWWDYLPACCTDAALYLGVTPPKRGGGRLAWSGDERQRYWQFGGGGEGVAVDERVAARRPGGRGDLLLLEDLDEARLQQQQVAAGGAGRMLRVDSRNSFTSQDPRRSFILRDARGHPRLAETVREGEHYLMEDVDGSPRGLRPDDPRLRLEDPRTLRVEEPRPAPPPAPPDEEGYARQGNGEDLRLHASPPGAAPRDDGAAGRRGRPPRRAGGGPGGRTTEGTRRLRHEDAGGGEGGGGGGGASPPLADVMIQTEVPGAAGPGGAPAVPRLRIRTPILEETSSLLEAEGLSRRETQRYRRPARQGEAGAGGEDGEEGESPEDWDSGSAGAGGGRRAIRLSQPANSLYQHNKASIMRFETNKARLGEGAAQEAPAPRRAASTSAPEGRRSSSLDGRRGGGEGGRRAPGSGPPGLTRRGSLPSLALETTGLEREAAARRSHPRRHHDLPAADGRSRHSSEDDADSEPDASGGRRSRPRANARYMEWYERARSHDPRHAPRDDARHHDDPRYQDDPAYPDPRYPDPRYADPRYPDPRYPDPRYPDPRYADPRYPDPRYADPRYDPRYPADPRYGDPRYADPRYQDPRYAADPRYGDPRYADPHYSDPRLHQELHLQDPRLQAPGQQDAPRQQEALQQAAPGAEPRFESPRLPEAEARLLQQEFVAPAPPEEPRPRVPEAREAAEGSEEAPAVPTEAPAPTHAPQAPDGKTQEGADAELRALLEEEGGTGGAGTPEGAGGRARRPRNPLMEKKSIFTIAYDDMRTRNLRPESAGQDAP